MPYEEQWCAEDVVERSNQWGRVRGKVVHGGWGWGLGGCVELGAERRESWLEAVHNTVEQRPIQILYVECRPIQQLC